MPISTFTREFGGMIWTDHAIDRLKKRRIDQADALLVLKKPDLTFPGKKDDSVKFIKTVAGRKIHVVAVLNEYKRWVVLSVWVRGEEDQNGLLERFFGWIVDRIVGGVKWGWRKLVDTKK